jgi:hypothetical protein
MIGIKIINHGDCFWHFTKGVLHRTDGPAFHSDKIQEWYLNHQYHREDGPARIHLLTKKVEFWLNHKFIGEADFSLPNTDQALYESYLYKEPK